MSKTKKIFSLIMAGLLLIISAGSIFADEDSSDGEDISLEEAAKDLGEKLMGRPGIKEVEGKSYLEEKGAIVVSVENAQLAAMWLPDSFEGFPVWIEHGLDVPGPHILIGIVEPITSWRTDNQPGRIKTFTGSFSPSPVFETSYVGTSNLATNNILPNLQAIEMNSKMAEFSTPPIPKMTEFSAITQPQSHWVIEQPHWQDLYKYHFVAW